MTIEAQDMSEVETDQSREMIGQSETTTNVADADDVADKTGTDMPDDTPCDVREVPVQPRLSEEDLAVAVAQLLEGKDLESTSLGDFRASLEAHLKVEAGSLEGKKEKIQELLMANLQGGRTRKAKRKGHREVDWLRSLRRVKTEKAKSEHVDGEDLKEMHDPAVNMPSSLQVQIEGQKLTIEKKAWRTGEGYGYYGLTRVKIPADDGTTRTLLCQVSAVAVEGDD